MLNPIEKFEVAILHLNRDWNHCYGNGQSKVVRVPVSNCNLVLRKNDPHHVIKLALDETSSSTMS